MSYYLTLGNKRMKKDDNRYRKAIKNYTSSTSVSNIVSAIQKILLQFGATGIGFEYSNNGLITGIMFKIEDKDGNSRAVKVPSQWEKCKEVLVQQGYYKSDEQAYRTALANIRDWLDAQLALLQTDMVEFRQIFLPYMTNMQGQTVYEYLEQTKYKLLENSNS